MCLGYLCLMQPRHTYERLAETASAHVQTLERSLHTFTGVRLAAFGGVAVSIYAAFSLAHGWAWLALPCAAVFLYAVKWHSHLRQQLAAERTFLMLCRDELDVLRGHWRTRPDGAAYVDEAHPYASDLNVFGPHSLFQYMNRCRSAKATHLFAERLRHPLPDVAAIERHSALHAELALDPAWSLRYLTLAKLHCNEEADAATHAAVHTPTPAPGSFYTMILPMCMAAIAFATAVGVVPVQGLLTASLLTLGITAWHHKRHTARFEAFTAWAGRAAMAEGMLNMLLGRSFGSPGFRQMVEAAQLRGSAAALRKLRRIAGAVESRNNMVVSIALNAFLLWDFQCMRRIAAWEKLYLALCNAWFQLATEVESLQCEGLFVHNHPHFAKAELSPGAPLSITGGVHPLMGPEAVSNDLDMGTMPSFYIITGANMAGKSTYLRMVGVNLLLAMRGLPVAAKHMRLQPVVLYTSMLTTDSLGEHASYFFAELHRLRAIVDSLESGRPHFLILDEILKGTNSTDKAEGSRQFLEKLLTLPASGLIATHDLSLCTVASSFPERVRNMRFEVHFEDGALQFDYRLQPGVCQNMNASFLLRSMGLTTGA